MAKALGHPVAHPSNSKVQQAIESAMLRRYERANPELKLADWASLASELKLPEVCRKAQIDGVWTTERDEVVIAECYVRISKSKSGSDRKLAKDALKLNFIKAQAPAGKIRCLILLPKQGEFFKRSTGWLREAVEGIAEIERVELLPNELRQLHVAVLDQSGGQSRIKRADLKKSQATLRQNWLSSRRGRNKTSDAV